MKALPVKRKHLMWYAALLIAAVVVALAFGVPASTVLVGLIVLACPVMMIFMMSGGHSHSSDRDAGDTHKTHNPRGTA